MTGAFTSRLGGVAQPDPAKFGDAKARAARLGVDIQLQEGQIVAIYQAGRLPFAKRFASLVELSVWLDAVEVNHA
ncbi:MAG: hypothetical protein B7Y54_06420 [Polaromonas sp. 35-63-240]|nr:hypothetical protein [Polaromonas sp.]OYY52584.1 MAG: hypothetical protein B7Y54_06420 [Polaromonas sp. 35-63-240]